MPKKKKNIGSSSLKKPSQGVEKPVIQQTKRVRKPRTFGKEIDEIFGGRKRKTLESENKETKEEIAKRERKRKRKEREKLNKNPRTQPSKRIEDNPLDPLRKKTGQLLQNRPRKRTDDGLLVFTEAELGVNKANSGYTPLCPFDCACCF